MKFFLPGGVRLCRALTRRARLFSPFFFALLFFTFGARAQTTNGLTKAEIQGQAIGETNFRYNSECKF